MKRIMCYKCGEWLEVKKNGVKVRPKNYYGYFHADLFYCPKCGLKVLGGFGSEIVSDADVDIDYNDEL